MLAECLAALARACRCVVLVELFKVKWVNLISFGLFVRVLNDNIYHAVFLEYIVYVLEMGSLYLAEFDRRNSAFLNSQ